MVSLCIRGSVRKALRSSSVVIPFTSFGLCSYLTSISTNLHLYKLSSHPAAVDGEDGAMDIITGGRRQENGRSFKIIGLTPPACGNPVEDRLAADGIIAKRFRIVRADISGRNAVDIHAL